jgi:hypothetical protein
MTWAPRDVVSVILVVALCVAFDAVVIAAAIRGDVAGSTGDALASGFILLAAILVAVLGIHLTAHHP